MYLNVQSTASFQMCAILDWCQLRYYVTSLHIAYQLQNANSQSYFLYPQTKGLAEDAVISQGFPSTTIFRPGLLERKDKARLVEKIASWIIPSVHLTLFGQLTLKGFEFRFRSANWQM